MVDLFTNVCPTCQRPLDRQDEDAEFAEWWAGEAKKIGKAEALKEFRKARKKAPLDVLIAKRRGYCSGRERQFICEPARWLRRERWTDEEEQQQEVVDLQRRHVEAFIRKGIWLDTWGERPDHPNADPRVRRIYHEMVSIKSS